jgi:hypothetical protein
MAVAILLIALFTSQLYAQKKDSDKQAAIAKMVAARNYVFKAQTALPMGPAPNRQLTTDYDLKVSPDTVVSFLPYFGRAYTAPMDPTKGGIMFTSTKFDYTEGKKKKGGWEIMIKPHDTQEANQLSLYISESGFASLQVIGNNRQPISFSGYIEEKKSKK